MKIDYLVVGSRIRKYRLERGITQEDLAFQINTSAAYISNIERGIKRPSLQKLVEIASVMHVTVNDFLYTSPCSTNSSFDRDFQYLISMCTPEKQRIITKNIAEIIQAMLED